MFYGRSQSLQWYSRKRSEGTLLCRQELGNQIPLNRRIFGEEEIGGISYTVGLFLASSGKVEVNVVVFLLLCSSVYRFIVVGSSGRAKVLRNCVQHMGYFGHCRAAEREGSRNQSFRFLSERIVQRVFFFFFRPYYFSLFFPLLFCLAVPFLSFQHRGEFLPKNHVFFEIFII